jgi:hypothetical protein
LGGSARIIAGPRDPVVFPFINAWTVIDEGSLVMANEGALRSLLGDQFCQMTEAIEMCCLEHDEEDDRET